MLPRIGFVVMGIYLFIDQTVMIDEPLIVLIFFGEEDLLKSAKYCTR